MAENRYKYSSNTCIMEQAFYTLNHNTKAQYGIPYLMVEWPGCRIVLDLQKSQWDHMGSHGIENGCEFNIVSLENIPLKMSSKANASV